MTSFHVLPDGVDGQGQSPARVRHDLAREGLLDLDRLAGLAAALPATSVEHNLGAVPDVVPGGEVPRAPLTPPEIVRSIDTNGCWLVLKNIEQDPEYAALLDRCVEALAPRLTGDRPRLLCEGFVFLSAPGSVTPTHLDPEHNVLLQVDGTKTMSIGRFPSPQERDRQIEGLHADEHRNLKTAAVELTDFPLGPGDGVYVPVHAPHLVRNGPTASISLSVTWRTPESLRVARVHRLNGRLRSRGLPTVAAVGERPLRDRGLEAAERAVRLVSRLSRR